MITSKKLLFVALPLLSGLAFSLLTPPQHASALDVSNYTNYIMDDSIMRDSGSMSDIEIQAFLNSQGSGLAGFSDIEDCGPTSGSNYSYYATYYACGQRASAAQIIGAAGRAYGINPRVILATLQKEQSLVTASSPTASQLNCAMGYSSCSGYVGFYNQVDNATWQFRAYMELGSGRSWWGRSPSSYPCNSAKSLYSAPLKAGSNVTFYDTNGTAYANITLANMATAGFYCYTPHVYNNPNGLYGNPRQGTTGLYYSGTYNFVKSYVAWWGSTYTPSFQATYVGQSAPPTVVRGNSTYAFVKYQNTGNKPWYDDVTAGPLNTYPVHLATGNPVNAYNQFSAFWPTRNRAATVFARVYESNGSTLAANQHVAQPGQIIDFEFPFSIPSNTTPGYYQNFVQPVLEGSSMWNMGGLAHLDMIIEKPTFEATFAGQSGYPTIMPGETSAALLKYRNTGNQSWYDDTSAPGRGTNPVHLASTNPINKSSPFSATWPANSRPAANFAKVYESNGSTLAANQHVAQPGQIVEFNFTFTVPEGQSAGKYTQYFQPILEGSSSWDMGALSWLDVTVPSQTYVATFAGQSGFPTVSRGQSTPAFLSYKNSGNRPWYDDVTASANNARPVHLASTNPINKSNPFSATWPTNNRPALTFARVYESNGSTLAANQHVAQPGQIVQFDFNFSIPSGYSLGKSSQFFQPIVEGSPNWDMGALSWLDVTVQ